MKEGYIIRNQEKPHFITITVVDWIDVFTRQCYKDTIIESLEFCKQKKGMILFGYVIMSNHIHLIVQSDSGRLSDLIRDFKKFTARTILAQIREEPESRRYWMLDRFKAATETHIRNKNYQFWQYGNHAEEIYTENFLWTKLDYIHLNPVRAGWVDKPEHYIYSSAVNYIGEYGVIEINKADNPLIDVLKPSVLRNVFL